MNETQILKIHEFFNERDLSKYGIYTILRFLKINAFISKSMYELLLKVVEKDMFCLWRASYLDNAFEYEKALGFVEARILEYFRNMEYMTMEQAEEVLEYIREFALSLSIQTLQNTEKTGLFHLQMEWLKSINRDKYRWIPMIMTGVSIISLVITIICTKGKLDGRKCYERGP